MSFQILSFGFDEKVDSTDTISALNVMNGKGLEERPAEVNEARPGSERSSIWSKPRREEENCVYGNIT